MCEGAGEDVEGRLLISYNLVSNVVEELRLLTTKEMYKKVCDLFLIAHHKTKDRV